jgi:hypothetical protein
MAGDSTAFRESPPVYAKLLVSRNGPGTAAHSGRRGVAGDKIAGTTGQRAGQVEKLTERSLEFLGTGDWLMAAVSALAPKWSAMLFPREIAFPQIHVPVHSQ